MTWLQWLDVASHIAFAVIGMCMIVRSRRDVTLIGGAMIVIVSCLSLATHVFYPSNPLRFP